MLMILIETRAGRSHELPAVPEARPAAGFENRKIQVPSIPRKEYLTERLFLPLST